jgi:phospholipid-transporting ATPase
LLNFLPKNLALQFSKAPNLYFLSVAVMEAIGPISLSNGVPFTSFPLSIIVLLSMIKDLFEDGKRRRADLRENQRLVLRYDYDSKLFKNVPS